MPISETSNQPTIDAVRGESTAQGGTGIHAVSDSGPGLYAVSMSGRGIEATSTTNYGIRASSTKSAGLRASSIEGRGAEGWSTDHEGVVGTSKTGVGVYGTGTGVAGVVGDSQTGNGRGVEGRSSSATGVYGVSVSGRGVEGWSNSGFGVYGDSQSSAGVRGTSQHGRGTEGWSTDAEGVFGLGKTGGYFEGAFEGVHAVSHDAHAAGVAGYNDKTGPGIFGKSVAGAAGYFDGDVVITGVIHMARGDYAEDFTAQDPACVEPGMVMVLDQDGSVRVSDEAYDRRVAGVVSGAGGYKPAVILDHNDALPNRVPLALMGKAYCMVDASEGSIELGDPLTTSAIPGHAMKAVDPLRAFGSVIGKALQPLASGRGLLPVLVRLQ